MAREHIQDPAHESQQRREAVLLAAIAGEVKIKLARGVCPPEARDLLEYVLDNPRGRAAGGRVVPQGFHGGRWPFAPCR
jgi:hypothetical protein